MRTNEDKAQALHIAYYGRPADPVTWRDWTDKLAATATADEILQAFGGSEEYLTSFGLLDFDSRPVGSAQHVINELYLQMFDRDAGKEGLDFYSNLLATGEATIASIALDILNGATGGDLVALDNKIEVANYFTSEVLINNTPYGTESAPAAIALLQIVDNSSLSVAYALDTVDCVVDAIVDASQVDGTIDHTIQYDECFSSLPDAYQPDPFPGYTPPDIDVI